MWCFTKTIYPIISNKHLTGYNYKLTYTTTMKINVGVVFGGRSVENEISVITANQAMAAMDREKYDITPIYITKTGKWYTGDALFNVANYRDTKKLLAMCEEVYMRPIYGDTNLYRCNKGFFQKAVVTKLDVILPALHGTNCEDGTFQGVMEFSGIPYTGCNTLASANGMDKITMKMILKECGIPVIDYCWFSDKEWSDKQESTVAMVEEKLGYPVIVKPANSGSSVGIRAAHNREEFLDAVDYAISFTSRIIIEKYVQKLKEVNCAVLGNYYECEPSVCEVPVRSGEILSYQDKYMNGGGKQSQGMPRCAEGPREIRRIFQEGVFLEPGVGQRAVRCALVDKHPRVEDGDDERHTTVGGPRRRSRIGQDGSCVP